MRPPGRVRMTRETDRHDQSHEQRQPRRSARTRHVERGQGRRGEARHRRGDDPRPRAPRPHSGHRRREDGARVPHELGRLHLRRRRRRRRDHLGLRRAREHQHGRRRRARLGEHQLRMALLRPGDRRHPLHARRGLRPQRRRATRIRRRAAGVLHDLVDRDALLRRHRDRAAVLRAVRAAPVLPRPAQRVRRGPRVGCGDEDGDGAGDAPLGSDRSSAARSPTAPTGVAARPSSPRSSSPSSASARRAPSGRPSTSSPSS